MNSAVLSSVGDASIAGCQVCFSIEFMQDNRENFLSLCLKDQLVSFECFEGNTWLLLKLSFFFKIRFLRFYHLKVADYMIHFSISDYMIHFMVL